MSAKKSWDIQPKARKKESASYTAQAPTSISVRKRVQASLPVQKRATETKSATSAKVAPSKQSLRPQPLPKGSLKQRRKKKRQTARYVSLIILLVFIAGFFYTLWRPFVRVQQVTVQGPDSSIVQQIAANQLAGTYWYVVPHNSIFFLPLTKIRTAVLDASPDLAAVSFSRTSFSSLEIRTNARATSFVWCGTSFETPDPDGSCFDADIEGLLFKVSDSSEVGTTTFTTNQIRIFSNLDRDISDGKSPIRAHVSYSSAIPESLKFVTSVQQLGIPVSALAFRGDEADMLIGSSTRITYVLGQEQQAAELAATALPDLALTNGSIQYVDLRFPGKVYVKKYGE